MKLIFPRQQHRFQVKICFTANRTSGLKDELLFTKEPKILQVYLTLTELHTVVSKEQQVSLCGAVALLDSKPSLQMVLCLPCHPVNIGN